MDSVYVKPKRCPWSVSDKTVCPPLHHTHRYPNCERWGCALAKPWKRHPAISKLDKCLCQEGVQSEHLKPPFPSTPPSSPPLQSTGLLHVSVFFMFPNCLQKLLAEVFWFATNVYSDAPCGIQKMDYARWQLGSCIIPLSIMRLPGWKQRHKAPKQW